MPLSTAALCLALNVYYEARGEPLTGQHAVAQVTMNRAGRDPDRICAEVFKPSQFSWANGIRVRYSSAKLVLPKRYLPKEGSKEWTQAKNIANWTVAGFVPDFTKGATYFHTVDVRPSWRRGARLTYAIGRHKFYASA